MGALRRSVESRSNEPRSAGSRPGVFLDRDGVLNEVVVRDGRPYPPPSLEALRILPGVREALVALSSVGLPLIVVTNQPDVRTGVQRRASVDAMHARLRSELPLDAILACFHVDADRCACRKPGVGMLFEAAARFGLDLEASFLVGDRWRDIDAGTRAGCETFFIDRGYRERRPERPDHVVADLAEAAVRILDRLACASRPCADERDTASKTQNEGDIPCDAS